MGSYTFQGHVILGKSNTVNTQDRMKNILLSRTWAGIKEGNWSSNGFRSLGSSTQFISSCHFIPRFVSRSSGIAVWLRKFRTQLLLHSKILLKQSTALSKAESTVSQRGISETCEARKRNWRQNGRHFFFVVSAVVGFQSSHGCNSHQRTTMYHLIARNSRHFAPAIASGRSKRIAVWACAVHITNIASSQNIVYTDILRAFLRQIFVSP